MVRNTDVEIERRPRTKSDLDIGYAKIMPKSTEKGWIILAETRMRKT